jgi:hypothetical protein
MRYRVSVKKMSGGSITNARVALVLRRDSYTCQMCGATTTDLDPYDRKYVRLQVGFRVPPSEGGSNATTNLRTLCSSCAEGLVTAPYLPRLTISQLLNLLENSSPSDLKTLQTSLQRSLRAHI